MNEQETAVNPPVEEAPAETQIYQYQPVDEQGNPIGRPTRFEYSTIEEFQQKMERANQEAVRALFRLKNQKPAPAKPETKFQPEALTADQEYQAGLELQNPATAGDAVLKLVKSRLPITDIEKDAKETAAARRRAGAEAAMYQFLQRHLHDFYNCHANGKMMGEWIIANGYDITSPDSLEAAFAALADQLAQSPVAPPADVPPVAANPAPARSASSGIEPGRFNGIKPVKSAGLTKKAAIAIIRAKHTNPAEYRRYMNDPKLKAELDKALAS
jgi:hypothetical protein